MSKEIQNTPSTAHQAVHALLEYAGPAYYQQNLKQMLRAFMQSDWADPKQDRADALQAFEQLEEFFKTLQKLCPTNQAHHAA
ncbi:hypothetical protein CL622_07000 [archaeon]|nr:hypothetical protein [archaeon]|tara:strand:- start:464 stop:709 length:246 start_codon:yes stop_codon:yes gene_type:complete